MADIPIPSIECGSSGGETDGRPSCHSTPGLLFTPSSSSSSHAETGSVHGSDASQREIVASARSDFDQAMPPLQQESPDLLNMTSVSAALDVTDQQRVQAASLSGDDSLLGRERPASTVRRRSGRSRSNTPLNRYDVASEDPPLDAFNKPSFQAAFRDVKSIVSNIATVLGSGWLHNDPNSTVSHLHEKARALAGFQCSNARTVGFVGDSGVGKSSLINSLLDAKGLAREGGNGTACTCIATEFRFHEESDLAVHVEHFRPDERSEQLADLLKSYRTFELNKGNMSSKDSEDNQLLNEKHELALDTFRAMFGRRLGDEAFLLENPEESVLETLKNWTEEILASERTDLIPGLTLQECSDLLTQLESHRNSSDEFAIWPYIRKVKVFLNAHILRNGLVLVDLPGLRDRNAARRNVTERFLRQCDEIFVVCDIIRALSDHSVKSGFSLAKSAGVANVGIICTKSEVVKDEQAQKHHIGPVGEHINRLRGALSDNKSEVYALELEFRELNAEPVLSVPEQNEWNDLRREIREATRRGENARFELNRYLMRIRNDEVTRNLREIYGQGVAVFCGSNELYWNHREEDRSIALGHLLLSCIIDIRRHCISIVSAGQHRAALQYMLHNVPALLAQIQLWVKAGAGSTDLGTKQRVHRILDALEEQLRRDLTSSASVVNVVSRILKGNFDEEVYSRRQISDWSQAARKACENWEMWSHQTHRAFCGKYGIHSTQAVGYRNWNEEAIEGMVQDIDEPWKMLLSMVRQQKNASIQFIESRAYDAVICLESVSDNLPSAGASLTQAIEKQLIIAANAVEEAFEDFEEQVSSLHVDAFSGLSTSFMGRTMESTYRRCGLEHGGGSHGRRKNIIRQKLAQERIFSQLMRDCRECFRQLADGIQDTLRDKVAAHIDIIHEVLGTLRHQSAAHEDTQDMEMRARVDEALKKAQSRHAGILGSIAS